MEQMEQTKESVKNALAALETETREVVQASKRLNENLVEAVNRTWRQLLLIWIVVIALAVSYLLVLNRGWRNLQVAAVPPVGEARPEGAPATAPPEDIFPPIPEREELVTVLNQLREAQYKKDIDRFLQAYAPDFPELQRKRELTLSLWRRYDYLNLRFHVTDIQRLDEGVIAGDITWEIKARDRKTDAVRSLSKTYRVRFTKAAGQWLIQSLEAVGEREPQSQGLG